MGGLAECGNWPRCGCTRLGDCEGDDTQVSADTRLRNIQRTLAERGLNLRGVTWAEGAKDLTSDERKHDMADFLQAFLKDDGNEVHFLYDDRMMTGDELVGHVEKLEFAIRDLLKFVRYAIDVKKVDPGFFQIGISNAEELLPKDRQ